MTGGSINWPSSTPKSSTVSMKSPPSPSSSNSGTDGSVKSPSSPRIISQGDVNKLGPGAGSYGHNNLMRAGAVTKNVSESSANSTEIAHGNDPEELQRLGNEEYYKGNFEDASGFYDRAISLLPTNASYKANRAAALMSLGRLEEALKECQEAVELDPAHASANRCLSYLLKRFGQVQEARMHLHIEERCIRERKIGDEKFDAVSFVCDGNISNGTIIVASKYDKNQGILVCADSLSTAKGDPLDPKIYGESVKLHVISDTKIIAHGGRKTLTAKVLRELFDLEGLDHMSTEQIALCLLDISVNLHLETFEKDAVFGFVLCGIDKGQTYIYKIMKTDGGIREYFNGIVIGSGRSSAQPILNKLPNDPSYTVLEDCMREAVLEAALKTDSCGNAILMGNLHVNVSANIKVLVPAPMVAIEVSAMLSAGQKVRKVSTHDQFLKEIHFPVVLFCFMPNSNGRNGIMLQRLYTLSTRYNQIRFVLVDTEKYQWAKDLVCIPHLPTFRVYKAGQEKMEITSPNGSELDIFVKDSLEDS